LYANQLTIIRVALELNDPWLAEFVSRAEAGENIVDTFESCEHPITTKTTQPQQRSRHWLT